MTCIVQALRASYLSDYARVGQLYYERVSAALFLLSAEMLLTGVHANYYYECACGCLCLAKSKSFKA